MRKSIILLFIFVPFSVFSATRATPSRFINKTLYDNIYPSTLNDTGNGKMSITPAAQATNTKRNVVKRQSKNRNTTTTPQTTTIQSANNNSRRVVPRTNNMTRKNNVARAVSDRRVVARSAQNNTARTARLNRSVTAPEYTNTGAISSKRCFADYKTCMDSYCERSNTAYNRCYCSAKLAQIDLKYQDKIDSLIQEIIRLKYNTDATDAEIKSYWDATVGVYTKTNPWVNIDNALNIDWSDMASRVRGQNAFAAGHTYCVNHLRACSSMSTNMRDAYKSEIERDCSTYEKALEKIQTAAESVIETYSE